MVVEQWAFGIAVSLLGGAFAVSTAVAIRGQRFGLRRAQKGSGLQWRPPAEDRRGALVGQAGGFRVTVDHVAVRTSPDELSFNVTRIALHSGGRWPPRATLEGPWTAIDGTGPPVHRTPEQDADRQAATLALFDDRTRHVFDAWRRRYHLGGRGEAEIAAGTLTLFLKGVLRSGPAIAHHVGPMVEVARALDRGGRSIGQAIADGMVAHRVEDRRLRYRALARLAPADKAAAAACRAGLADEDPTARCHAAQGLGEEGLPTLALLTLDAKAPQAVRAQALAAWSTVLSADAAVVAALRRPESAEDPRAQGALRLVSALADSNVSAIRTEALVAAKRLRVSLPPDLLVRHVRHAGEEEAIVLSELLARHRGGASEAALLVLLARKEDHVRVAALEALRRAGTIDGVPAILPLTRGLLTPDDVRAAARAALEAIRSRMGGAEAGRLSLILETSSSGELSAPESQGGELAAPPGEQGSLSR